MSRHIPMGISLHKWPLGPFAVFLLAAMALGSLALLRMRLSVEHEIQLSELQLEHASRVTASNRVAPPARERTLSAVGERQWREQIALLNRDWGRLLNALVPREKHTRLLGIDVNPMTGVVRVSGITDSPERANAYAEALEANTTEVSQVRVLALKRSGQAVNFEVSASWGE